LRYTIVSSHIEADTLKLPTFSRSDFHHVNKETRNEMVRHGEIECLDANRAVWRYTSRKAAVRGFSAKHGEYLAQIRNTALGKLMVSEITMRPMEATT
jgi:hypothetical protein